MTGTNQPTRLVLIHRDDIRHKSTFSGAASHLLASLAAAGAEVETCDRLGYPNSWFIKLENQFVKLAGRTTYFRRRSARFYDRLLQRRLARLRPADGLIFVDALVPGAAFRHRGEPAIYFTDATYRQLMEQNYPGYSGLTPVIRDQILSLEGDLCERMDRLVFTSQWAARSSEEQFPAARNKTVVIPFGANLDPPPAADIAERRAARRPATCELLFIGVHWERKGGELAMQISDELNAAGVLARLTVCGTTPPHPESARLRVYPFLDKKREDHRKILHELFAGATYLLLPTRADCTPIVFCEAFAYGLPVVTCDVAGIGEVVKHGETGFVLPRGAPARDYAGLIGPHLNHAERYAAFCRNARLSFESRFNWNHSARAMLELVESLNARRRTQSASRSGYISAPR